MGTDTQSQSRQGGTQEQEQTQEQAQQGEQARNGQGAAPGNSQHGSVDGLKDKKPEELTPEELRLMADTMPGEGPGD